MKMFALTLVVLSALSGASFAVTSAPQKNLGPETVHLKMGEQSLPFQHWEHQKSLKNDCLHCHSKQLGKIEGWGKDAAHRICIPCHDLDSKGPVDCHQCHK